MPAHSLLRGACLEQPPWLGHAEMWEARCSRRFLGQTTKAFLGSQWPAVVNMDILFFSNWHVKCSRLGCVLGGFKLPKANHHGRWWRVDIPLRTRCSVEFVLNDGGHSILAGRSTVDGRFDWLVGPNLLGTEVGTIIQVRLATTLPKCQACTFWWTRSLRCLE